MEAMLVRGTGEDAREDQLRLGLSDPKRIEPHPKRLRPALQLRRPDLVPPQPNPLLDLRHLEELAEGIVRVVGVDRVAWLALLGEDPQQRRAAPVAVCSPRPKC